MTNESISGFLNSIAEAKRAFDAEPDYQRRIQSLSDDINRLQSTVASRELRIHDLKQNEETLTAKLRSVEAERDDAGFRALEEADKVQNLLGTLRQFVTDGLKVISAVEGKESIIVSREDYGNIVSASNEWHDKAMELEHEVQRLSDDMRLAQEQLTRPFASAAPSSNVEDTDPWSPKNWPEDQHPEATLQGQSEAVPTASASDPIPQGLGNEHPPQVDDPSLPQAGQSEGPFASRLEHGDAASPNTASSKDDASLHASPPERNRDRSTFFKGRKYFDVTYFVPLHKWLEDGGTREDYYWRPAEANVPLPEANRASHQS